MVFCQFTVRVVKARSQSLGSTNNKVERLSVTEPTPPSHVFPLGILLLHVCVLFAFTCLRLPLGMRVFHASPDVT